jgi:hypothetical protein
MMEVRPSDRWAVAWEMLPYTADEEQDLIDVAFTEPGGRHGLLPQRARRWRPGPSDGRAVAPVAEGGAEVRGAEGWSRATVGLQGKAPVGGPSTGGPAEARALEAGPKQRSGCEVRARVAPGRGQGHRRPGRATVELRGEGASGRGQATVVRGGAPSPGTRGWRLSGGTWIGFEERENPT